MNDFNYDDDPEHRPEDWATGTADGRGFTVGRLRVLSIAEVMELPPRDYVVKGWMSPAEMSLIVGAPKCGKTFFALYLGYAIAQGRNVFGRRVHQTPVLYVVAEGERGIAKRARALEELHGPCEHFHLIAQPVDLLRCDAASGDLNDLIKIARILRTGQIFIDTVSRVMAGGDENGPADMGRFVANLSELTHETGAHVAGVHHGTQADGTKSRGHNSLPAAVDVITQVVKEADGTRSATIAVSRDDADGARMGFRLNVVDFGPDSDGDPITTLTAEEMDKATAAKPKMAPSLETARRILLALISAEGETLPSAFTRGHPSSIPGVAEERWREECETQRLSTAEDRKSRDRVFRRTFKALLDGGYVHVREGIVWASEPPLADQ